MTEELTARLRERALTMARDLNPNTRNQSQGYSLMNQGETVPSIETILNAADKIYEWLIKQ